jgi:predicted ATPase
MFGLQPSGGRSATDTLLQFLRSKELLLVLDNCEHLLRSVADLVGGIVRGCPSVRVLATSREGLNVGGEHMLGVPSLDVSREGADFESIAACDAVTLFVDRARSVKASFRLDPSNASAVSQVCRRLDGIALAIELAAARVAMLTPSELARRLDQRFRLLAGGQRGVVERHQTLRAAIDWSYELLSEAEQLLLARLSVFAGGFSLDAAESVTAGGAVEADLVFDLLSALVTRSLVFADTVGADTRFRLLETIRQYAQEHLDDGDSATDLHTAHAAYYASFGEVAIHNTAGPEGVEWERRLEQELDNIGAALRWAVETQDAETAVRLIAMWQAPILQTDVSLTATLHWAADALVDIPGASDHPRYPAALAVSAAFAAWDNDQDLAARRCDDALHAEQRVGTEPSILVWVVRTNVSLAEGHPDEAVAHAGWAVELARARGEPAWLTFSLAVSALANALRGDAARALPQAEEVVALANRFANPHIFETPLAFAAFALGPSDPQRALAIAREALELIRPGERSLSWGMAGDLAARQGHQAEALQYSAKAIENAHWLGNRLGVGNVIGRVGDLLAETDAEACAVLHGACEGITPGYSHAPHTLEARQQTTATSQSKLGSARHEELYRQGKRMSDDEAVVYANAAIRRCLDEEPS